MKIGDFLPPADAKSFIDTLDPEEKKKTIEAVESMTRQRYWRKDEVLLVVEMLGYRTIAGIGSWASRDGEGPKLLLCVRQIGRDFKPTGKFEVVGILAIYRYRPAGISEVLALSDLPEEPGACTEWPCTPWSTAREGTQSCVPGKIIPYWCHETEIPF
jgi:hypothetical protein